MKDNNKEIMKWPKTKEDYDKVPGIIAARRNREIDEELADYYRRIAKGEILDYETQKEIEEEEEMRREFEKLAIEEEEERRRRD